MTYYSFDLKPAKLERAWSIADLQVRIEAQQPGGGWKLRAVCAYSAN